MGNARELGSGTTEAWLATRPTICSRHVAAPDGRARAAENPIQSFADTFLTA
jgi:hypothetical protein